MTLLEKIENRLDQVRKNSNRTNSFDHRFYYEGQIIGLLDAHKLVKEELYRLCNKFQNDALTVSDFGIVL